MSRVTDYVSFVSMLKKAKITFKIENFSMEIGGGVVVTIEGSYGGLKTSLEFNKDGNLQSVEAHE